MSRRTSSRLMTIHTFLISENRRNCISGRMRRTRRRPCPGRHVRGRSDTIDHPFARPARDGSARTGSIPGREPARAGVGRP